MQTRSQHRKKLQAYLLDEPQIAIFDIGTRAIRLLVGPKHKLSNWDHKFFFNASRLTNLGEDINQDMRIGTNSKGLQSIISFMNDFIPILRNQDIEVYAFGTAIFRWMKNAKDTITYVQRMTGVEICILSQRQEAYMSCLALYATKDIHQTKDMEQTKNSKEREDGNTSSNHRTCLLLIDQGGGSTEISLLSINALGELHDTKLMSFDDLGSIALRDKFLLTEQDTPSVLDQYRDLQNLIHQRIDDWNHFEELEAEVKTELKIDSQSSDGVGRDENPQIICYGMGSAVSNLFPEHNYIAHNQFVDLEMLSNFINTSKERFFVNNPNVDVFREELSKMNKGVQKRFLYTCALEVHHRILEKFGFSKIRMCGYGLRYGIFVHLVYLGKKIISKHPSA